MVCSKFSSFTHNTPKLYDEEAITQTCTEIHNVETILSNRCLTACSQIIFVVISMVTLANDELIGLIRTASYHDRWSS